MKITISRTTLILLGLYVLFIFFSPILFSKISTIVSFDAKSGAIGDTIGGITAPFINLLAAILVYLSFREQIKANEVLNKENQFNYITHFIEMVSRDIENENNVGKFNETNAQFIASYLRGWNDPEKFITTYVDGFATFNREMEQRYPKEKIKEIINNEISKPLFVLMGQTGAVLRLFKETHRLKVDKGITSFYLHRIATIVHSLQLNMLQKIFEDQDFLEKEVLNDKNLVNYTFCVSYINEIEEYGLMDFVSIG